MALLIGVDVYHHEGPNGKPSLAQLPSCRNDVVDLCNLLQSEKFGYEIFGKNPVIGSDLKDNSFRIIQKSIIKFFDSANLGDTLVFYFSGHGVPREDDEVFLATPEVDPTQPMDGRFPLSHLTKLVNRSKAREIVCIIDSCYSGAANIDLPSALKTISTDFFVPPGDHQMQIKGAGSQC